MTPSVSARAVAVAVLALAVILPAVAAAEPQTSPPGNVAQALIAAARAQDRKAAMALLDERVSIRFPARSPEEGAAEGQPFVIGYLDGLFDTRRGLSLEGAVPAGDAVRFLARDADDTRYAIELQVRGDRVVGVRIDLAPMASPGEVAVLDRAS